MADSNVVEIVDSIREAGAEDSTLYRLAAIGVNSVYSSYRNDKTELMDLYGRLPKETIAEMWDDLDSKLKVSYVDANVEDFKNWIRNG